MLLTKLLSIFFALLNIILAILETVAMSDAHDFQQKCDLAYQTMILSIWVHYGTFLCYTLLACMRCTPQLPNSVEICEKFMFGCVWIISLIHFVICGIDHMCQTTKFMSNMMTLESILFIIYTIIISVEIIRSVCAACRVTEVTGSDTLYTARANEATDMRSLI